MLVACAASIGTVSETAEAETPPESYALPLGLSYLTMPALAGAGAALFGEAGTAGGAAAVSGVILLGASAPAIVHGVHGEPERAATSALGLVGSAVVVGAAGALVGSAFATQCPEPYYDGTDDCAFGSVYIPMVAGAAIGYFGWTVYDTGFRSSTNPKAGVVTSGAGASAAGAMVVNVVPNLSASSGGVALTGLF